MPLHPGKKAETPPGRAAAPDANPERTMFKIRQGDRRQVGCTVEGHGEYATRWPEHEYRCPECGNWSGGSDVSLLHDDGTESLLCPPCAEKAPV